MNQPPKPTHEHKRTELVISTRTILRTLITVTLFIAGIDAIIILKDQLVWIAIAFFLALALTPAVDKLAKYMPRKSRGTALSIVLLITIALIIYMVTVLAPPMVEQLSNLVKNFPDYWNNFLSSNNALGNLLRNNNVTELALKNQDKLLGGLSNAGSYIGGAATGLIGFVTIFTLTFFMVIEGPRWIEVYWRYQNPKRRSARQAIAMDMYETVSGFVAGNVGTSVVAAAVTTIFLLIMGVPAPLALGILVGILDLIPMIGATLAAVVVSLFVLAYGGIPAGLISVIFFIVYQQIENNILQPLVYSKSVSISPLVVGIAAVCGGVLGGFFGALVAIPVAASIQILVKDLLERRDEVFDKI